MRISVQLLTSSSTVQLPTATTPGIHGSLALKHEIALKVVPSVLLEGHLTLVPQPCTSLLWRTRRRTWSPTPAHDKAGGLHTAGRMSSGMYDSRYQFFGALEHFGLGNAAA